jgi:hypothetical protein
MKRLLIAGVVLAATFAGAASPVLADPVDDTLEIDGTPIITRTAAPEGHPFDELCRAGFSVKAKPATYRVIRSKIPA